MNTTFNVLFNTLGLCRNSGSWQDYEKAKKYIAEGNLKPNEYQNVIKQLCDYLGL